MLLIIQLILYCLLFFLMVKAAVKDNGMNCLYFYPPAFIDEAARRGLADKDETMKRGKRFMVPFCIIMLVVLIIVVWNRVTTFTAAYWQAVLFLVVMNWFDGICMDLVWVAHGKEWAGGHPLHQAAEIRPHQAHRRDGPLLHHRPARSRRRCAGGEHLLTSRININRLPHYAAGSFSFN